MMSHHLQTNVSDVISVWLFFSLQNGALALAIKLALTLAIVSATNKVNASAS